jgi:hypothetical protein
MRLSTLSKSPRSSLLWLLALACFCVLATKTASAYSPEDPEVRSMVDRAVKYLEGLSEDELKSTPYGGGDAQVVLAAYAHYKAVYDPDAPLVKLGIKNAMQYVNTVKSGKFNASQRSMYELPVVIMFLAELDPQTYAADLKMLGDTLFSTQKGHGGFGYPDYKTGDISQVQYVTLASWTLDRAGVELPLDRVAAMLGWVMRVQDPSGAWPYQGEDPGPGRGLVVQPHHEMSVTMALAGGSCALIGSDVFRLWNSSIVGSAVEGLPKSLKPVEKSTVLQARRKKSPVKSEAVLAALKRMEGYRSAHAFKRGNSADWYYYYLYTMERYESFIELAVGKPAPTDWYDSNVTALMNLQDSSGAWAKKDAALSRNGAPVSTSFAILFLIRSTKKAIVSMSKGSMAGGYKLPSDTTKIVVDGTQIKSEPTTTAVTDLLGLLEKDGADNIDNESIPENLKLETDPERRRIQLDRLKRLVRGSRSWQARRVAARLLGTSDELTVVPALIYALSDNDKPVRSYALDGLNFISRKFDSDIDVRNATQEEIRLLQNKWTNWYQQMYPGYIEFGQD